MREIPNSRADAPVAIESAIIAGTQRDRIFRRTSFRWPHGGKIYPGSDLLSQSLTGQVPSALVGLTTEFGMGSGVAPPEKPPGKSISKRIRQRQTPEGSNDKAKPHDQLVQVRSTP